MKSGLEGRNNVVRARRQSIEVAVSMKSGLEGRNNENHPDRVSVAFFVSMKSGLEGRNNKELLCLQNGPTIASQ